MARMCKEGGGLQHRCSITADRNSTPPHRTRELVEVTGQLGLAVLHSLRLVNHDVLPVDLQRYGRGAGTAGAAAAEHSMMRPAEHDWPASPRKNAVPPRQNKRLRSTSHPRVRPTSHRLAPSTQHPAPSTQHPAPSTQHPPHQRCTQRPAPHTPHLAEARPVPHDELVGGDQHVEL